MQSKDSHQAKKRRLQGACDACRAKKTKCDSAESAINVCTNCRNSNVQCKHDMPRNQRYPDKNQATIEYIGGLLERIQRLENYIRKLHPGEDIDRIISTMSTRSSRPFIPANSRAPPGPSGSMVPTTTGNRSPSNTTADSSTKRADLEDLEAEDLAQIALCTDLEKLSTIDREPIFFGQASTLTLVKHVTDARNKITGDTVAVPDPTRYRRSMYWKLSPWETSYISDLESVYIYPDDDLLTSLISLYFEKTNSIIPVLHYPTFIKSVVAGQHHWDPSFGMTVLLVCALGSRYSHDSRVMVLNDTSGLSTGWNYFCQVPLHRKQLLEKSCVYDLQYYALAAMYLVGSSMPHAGGNLIAFGLRYAYERGVHRRKGHQRAPTVENELLKRAFWALVCLDCHATSIVGRPYSTHETYDVEYPVECDDEYWETDDPEAAFRQPAGRPCSITAFLYFIRLCEILGFALKTLYANKKSKMLSGFIGADWEERMVAELDSSMNKWRDHLPSYLQWDSERQDPTFFHQSAHLHLTFNYVQIQIHRPYLTKKSSLTLPSIAICNSAARACSRILDASRARGARVLPNAVNVAYTAGMVITLSLLADRSNGQSGDPRMDTENLQKCVNYLKEIEDRWKCAGKLRDSLREAGAIPDNYEPTFCDQHFQIIDAGNIPQPGSVGMSEDTADVLQTGFSDTRLPNTAPGVMPMLDEWELQRLLLVKMGYLPEEPSSIGNSNEFTTTGDAGLHSLYPEVQTLTPSGTDSFVPPPDALNIESAFNLDEWDKCISPMGNLWGDHE